MDVRVSYALFASCRAKGMARAAASRCFWRRILEMRKAGLQPVRQSGRLGISLGGLTASRATEVGG